MEILEKFANWLRSRGVRESSVYRYLKAVRVFLREVGSIDNINIEALEAFTAKRKSHAHGLKVFLKFLGRYDLKFKQMYEEYRLPKRDMKLPQILTKEEVRKLIDAAEKLRDKVLIAVTYETGARISEILNLTVNDVTERDFGFEIVIRDSKSKPRNVLVVEYAWLLKLYLRQLQPKSKLFNLKVRQAEFIVSRLARKAGIKKKVTPHVLRHTRVTHMLRDMILNETEAMLWFGWHTRSMLDRYTHLTLRDVHSKVLNFYKKAKPREPLICHKCFQVNDPDALYCVRCGSPLGEKAEEEVKEEVNLRSLVMELAKEIELLKLSLIHI